MKPPEVLLAKRPRDPIAPLSQETLTGHARGVMQAFISLFGPLGRPTRLFKCYLNFFSLNDDMAESFWVNGFYSCPLHDAGKATPEFQSILKGAGNGPILYHEHLSALILALVRPWLGEIPGVDADILISSVACHHLRADKRAFPTLLNTNRSRFLIYPSGVKELFSLLAEQMTISNGLKGLSLQETWSDNGIDKLAKEIKTNFRAMSQDDNRNKLLRAVRSALILADSAGSGLAREGKDIAEWISGAFSEEHVLSDCDIEEKIITPRIKQIGEHMGGFKWSGFQEAASELPERALLLAPCGSGKTLAAWNWIRGQLSHYRKSRVIFLYPTRGTATEGFRDYVSWAPEADAALVSGTAAYELEGMFEDPAHDRMGKNFTVEDRLFALGYWHRRIFSATVDQFLGFMQHSYRSTCLLPLLADSAIVIDEVHSFDKAMFSALKAFLRNFNVPVLCMTASLPRQRVEDLKECGLTVFPEDKTQFEDLMKTAEMPRYRVSLIQDAAEALRIARGATGKRVLWVVNTVQRCQELAKELNALCYHSRFRLQDRKERHNEVISAFRKNQPLIAVTTQVCEMSLDLDADVLITETAPVTSLIQRMGRCNRHAEPGSGRIGEVYIYEPERITPYVREDLNGTNGFINSLNGTEASQLKLEELLEQYGPGDVEPDKYAAFVESGPWAMSREEGFREENNYTVEAVLDCDVDEYLSLRRQHRPADGLMIQAPRKLASRDVGLGNRPLVAPSANYDHQYGLFNKPMEVNSGKS